LCIAGLCGKGRADALQVLYYAIGRSLILQPGEGHWFTAKDPYHPMLPPQAGLYVLQVQTQTLLHCD
jgi:hypothetical protein